MLLSEAENHIAPRVHGECVANLAQSQTLSTWRRSSIGTWEISLTPGQVYPGWLTKAKATRSAHTWVRSRTRSYYQ